jgi:hypothetical protein
MWPGRLRTRACQSWVVRLGHALVVIQVATIVDAIAESAASRTSQTVQFRESWEPTWITDSAVN